MKIKEKVINMDQIEEAASRVGADSFLMASAQEERRFRMTNSSYEQRRLAECERLCYKVLFPVGSAAEEQEQENPNPNPNPGSIVLSGDYPLSLETKLGALNIYL